MSIISIKIDFFYYYNKMLFNHIKTIDLEYQISQNCKYKILCESSNETSHTINELVLLIENINLLITQNKHHFEQMKIIIYKNPVIENLDLLFELNDRSFKNYKLFIEKKIELHYLYNKLIKEKYITYKSDILLK